MQTALACIRHYWEMALAFCRDWPVLEILAAIVVIGLYYRVWRVISAEQTDVGERTLGVTVVTGQLSALITSGALILGLLGAISVLLLGGKSPEVVKTHTFWAIMLVFVSIMCALVALGVVTTYIKGHNVALHKQIVLVTATSLLFLALALWRLTLAVWGILWP